MTDAILHYVYDPLCGWCYGAAPLLKAAREVVPVVLHAGGMMTGPQRQSVTPRLRAFVMQHDQRIAQLSGQPFGKAYFDGLLCNPEALFDSEPPITAVLAADELRDKGPELLARIQTAHYVEGQRIAEPTVLAALAGDIGIDADAFVPTFERLQGDATQSHIAASRELLARAGGGGFPTLLLEQQGHMQLLDPQAWYGRPAAWREWLLTQDGDGPAGSAAGVCRLDGCDV